jgi:glycosyltransferase involved in cell wall biosynthesis
MRTTVACLGDARREKGFETLVAVIRRLGEAQLLERFQFIVQCNYVSDDAAKMVNRNMRYLVDPRIRLFHTPLTRDDYERTLANADIVLLPYDQRAYWARPSGPFAEAMATGKPIIATSNTWMSEQIKKYDSGLDVSEDPAAICKALLDIANSYSDYALRAAKAATAWRRDHNADAFALRLTRGLEW